MSSVSLVKADSYAGFSEAVEKALSLLGFSFNLNARKIVLKPNLCCYRDHSTGETTNPRIVAALIDVLRNNAESDPEIFVVESDTSIMRCQHAFKILGYEKMAVEKNVKLINLSEDNSEKKEVTVEKHSFTFSIPKTITDADLFVNVPKLKSRADTKVSCALKNVLGCVSDLDKFEYHSYLDEAVVGLASIMKPDLCLVDGIMVRGKHTKRLGLLMAGSDPVAVDSAAAKIIGLDPRSVRHIFLAEKKKLGSMKYEVKGESIRGFVERFPRLTVKDKMRSAVSNVILKL